MTTIDALSVINGKTSVSETMRKVPLAEAQTALRKQNTFCETWTSVLLPKFCEKKLLPTQNFTEVGQSTAELWPKNDFFKWRPSSVLNFKFFFTFGYLAVIKFQIRCFVPNFI